MGIGSSLTAIDSHTAGHPTRVITGGIPPLEGESVKERQSYFQFKFDHLRSFILHEPRGHSAMVGVILTESKKADFGSFFLGSYNYLEMCGHATFGLAVTLDYMGLLKHLKRDHFTLEVPAGVIKIFPKYQDKRLISVTIFNVKSYLAAQEVPIEANGKMIGVDVAYGGNWYALVQAEDMKFNLVQGEISEALRVGTSIKNTLNDKINKNNISGLTEKIDSVLFYKTERDHLGLITQNLVILDSNKFDRSPCGTGTSAQIARMISTGQIAEGEIIRARNLLGIDFEATAQLFKEKKRLYVLPKLTGMAHITGKHSFFLDPWDPIPEGFLLK